MLQKALTAAGVLVAAVLFLQLRGPSVPWLPRAGSLTLLLLAVLTARAHLVGGRARARLHAHRFEMNLAGLMVLALAVRLPHIGGDLWHAPIDVDEHRLAENVRQFFVNGVIGYETVEHYPGVVFWILVAASLIAYVWALLTGLIGSLPEMSIEMFTLAGRVTNSVLAALTVLFTGLIGRELVNERVGLIAAVLVAIVPLSVDTTTLMRNDPGQALFLAATVYAALVAHRSDGRAPLVAAGALAGLATAIKYPSVFVLAPVLLVAALRRTAAERLLGASLVLLAFTLAVVSSNHFIWADFPNFLRQISDQVAWGGPRQWEASRDPGALRTFLLTEYGPGTVMLLLGAGYGAWTLGTGRSRAWVFWTFPLLYAWLTMQRAVLYPRWIYQLVPFASVAGAAGLAAVLSQMKTWNGWRGERGARLRTGAAVALSALALAQPLWGGLVSISRRVKAPTHELAETWLETRSAGATILAEQGVLRFEGNAPRVHRVKSLRETLKNDPAALCAVEWVVVPEPDKGQPQLADLRLATRIEAGTGFRSRTGLDYDVYATWRLTDPTRCGMPIAQ